CFDFAALSPKSQTTLQRYFEQNFTPYNVRSGSDPNGLFTGYYEASLKGSRTKTARYNIPLHTRPDDLVMVQLGEFREELKGQRIAGRVKGGNLKPYESREEIIAGKWPHHDKVLLWVDDPVDAFFVQIQGSGLVEMSDGTTMRIGYAGQNGHPYYAIGRELIKRGALTKESVSMQAIRDWLAKNPADADALMNTNKSYVFFREINGEGPIGGQGVALTAGRSLAIDRSLISYGLPIWTDIAAPTPDTKSIQKLMITQDTGGAIRGAVRGDVFWGYGATAETLAGSMKSKGKYWVLLPNNN
ncbi:MAG: murein transglycosylase A, partial [Alphaproteobacteria bacterium]